MNPRMILFAVIFAAPPVLKKWLLRRFCRARIGRGVRLSWLSAIVGSEVELGDYSSVAPLSLVWADSGVAVGRYSEISAFVLVYGSGRFRIGSQCYVGPMSMINVTEDVTFGDVVAIGPRSMIFTHGSYLPYTEGYWARFAPVVIGSKVWLAAGVCVVPGVRVGENVFVHAGSVLSTDVRDGSVMQGNPAVEVDRMERLQREMSPRRVERAIGQVLHHFAEVWPALGRGVRLESRDGRGYVFRYRGRRWRVEALGACDALDFEARRQGAHRLIVVAPKLEDWTAVPAWAHVFDLASMSTGASTDPLHAAIFRFMNWYYGIKFSYRDVDDPA